MAVEPAAALVARLADVEGVRFRSVGTVEAELVDASVALRIDLVDAPVLAHGQVELHHHVLEQAISRTRHRYGVIAGSR